MSWLIILKRFYFNRNHSILTNVFLIIRTQKTASSARILAISSLAVLAQSHTICSARIWSACPSASGSALSASRSLARDSFATSKRSRGRRLVRGRLRRRRTGSSERTIRRIGKTSRDSGVSRKSRGSWPWECRRWSSRRLEGSKWPS